MKKGLLAYSSRHGYRGPIKTIELDSTSDGKTLDKELAKHPTSGAIIPSVILAVEGQGATAYTKQKTNYRSPLGRIGLGEKIYIR